MKSLVRFLIGFLLLYQQLLLANCKVIKPQQQQVKHGQEIKLNYERQSNEMTHFNTTLEGSQVEVDGTSIKYTNSTPMSSESTINSLAHISEENHFNGRGLSKFRSIVHGVKRSLKKILHAWTYYGPEVGLCSCMFKYAWFTYPIVPEVTHAVMGRARRMVSGFMDDFWKGYVSSQSSEDHYRISNKVADTTADDYYDYQSSNKVYANHDAFRRNGQQKADNFPEKAPIVEKVNPQIFNVVDMLKNLQPKANVSDFVIRFARHIKFQPQSSLNVKQLRTVSDDGDRIKNFSSNQHDEAKATGNTAKPPTSKINGSKVNANDVVVINGRSFVQSGFKPNMSQIASKKVFDLALGPPPGLPSFNELPPADYSYYKGGVHHHVHDLRKDKGSYPSQVKGGGWLAFDFEDVILQALGLSNPGRSMKPSVVKCSKAYVFNVILRLIQTTFLH